MQSNLDVRASSGAKGGAMSMDEPPGIDPETGRFPPRKGSVVLAVGVLVAMVALAAMLLLTKRHSGLGTEMREWALICLLPPAGGAVVGFLSLRHPWRNAGLSLLLSFLLLFALIAGWVIYYLVWLPVFLPGLAVGATAGSTLRRHLRARKHRYFAEE
jgi:uncharacterized membrane protein YfcA